MTIAPSTSPGRSNRKARDYNSDIHRLREAGYTFASIHEALLQAGVQVSRTTVKREAARPPQADLGMRVSADVANPEALGSGHFGDSVIASSKCEGPANRSKVETRSYADDTRTGMQIVDEFMRGRTSNPLLQDGP